jgi:hypothetical protein
MDRELAAYSGPVVVMTVGLTEARARGHCGLPMVAVTSREGIGGIVITSGVLTEVQRWYGQQHISCGVKVS